MVPCLCPRCQSPRWPRSFLIGSHLVSGPDFLVPWQYSFPSARKGVQIAQLDFGLLELRRPTARRKGEVKQSLHLRYTKGVEAGRICSQLRRNRRMGRPFFNIDAQFFTEQHIRMYNKMEGQDFQPSKVRRSVNSRSRSRYEITALILCCKLVASAEGGLTWSLSTLISHLSHKRYVRVVLVRASVTLRGMPKPAGC